MRRATTFFAAFRSVGAHEELASGSWGVDTPLTNALPKKIDNLYALALYFAF